MDADTLETQASLSVPDSVQSLYTDGSSVIALTFSGLAPIDTSTNATGTPYAL